MFHALIGKLKTDIFLFTIGQLRMMHQHKKTFCTKGMFWCTRPFSQLSNPGTPTSDCHLVSPYSITSESSLKVMRI